MHYYPIFLNMRGRRAIVVGGGKVAERKVRKLVEAGARVRVISPELTARLARLAAQKVIKVTRRRYRKDDIAAVGVRRLADDAPSLVFAATNDPAAQRVIRRDAARAGTLVNIADDPAACGFIVPATVRRGKMHVAISSGGTDPALAKWLRQQLGAGLKKIKRQKANGKRQK